MTSILITSIGSFSAVSLVMCLAAVRDTMRLVGTNSVAQAAGNFLADRTVLVPATSNKTAWKEAVTRLLVEERPDLVLNGRDEELPLLGELREACDRTETRFLVPPSALAPLFNDKYETARFASEHGLAFAKTASSPSEVAELVECCGFPLIAKPRTDGFASTGAFLVQDQTGIDAAVDSGRHIVQELLPSPLIADSIEQWNHTIGVPWNWAMKSIDHEVDMLLDGDVIALCLSAGTAAGAFNQDIRIVDEPALRRVGEAYGRILARLGHKGPVNIQGRLLPDGRYVPFELNARFTGTTSGKAQLGFNMVMAALEHWCHIPSSSRLAPNGLSAQRLPTFAMTFDGAAARILAETGDWRKPR